jgi:hypothetical protein
MTLMYHDRYRFLAADQWTTYLAVAYFLSLKSAHRFLFFSLIALFFQNQEKKFGFDPLSNRSSTL